MSAIPPTGPGNMPPGTVRVDQYTRNGAARRASHDAERTAPSSLDAPDVNHQGGATSRARGEDRLEISATAHRLAMLDLLKSDPPIRHDLIAHVRAEIEAGRYDTPQRFDAALDQMLRDLTT